MSALSSLSLSTYTFSFFNTKSSSICHSFPCSSLTFTFFISSTTLITSSSLLLAFFIFSNILTSSPSIITSCKLPIQLSLSTPTFQSSLLFSPSVFPIFTSGTYFKVKLNLDKYKVYQACLRFNFCTFMKYSKFL